VGQLPQCRGCALGPGSGGIPSCRLVPADCSKCGTRACLLFVLLRWAGAVSPASASGSACCLAVSAYFFATSMPRTALPRTSTSNCASALSACALPTLWSERSPAGCGVDRAMKDLGSAFGASVPDGRALRLCQQQFIGKRLVSIIVGPSAKSTVLRSPQPGRNVSRSRIPCPSHRRKGLCLLVVQRAHRAGRSKEEAAQCDRHCLWGAFGSIEETSATSEAGTAPSLRFQRIPPRSV
jgi:hypothetical protein